MLQEPLIPTPLYGLQNVIKMITSQPNLDVDLFHDITGLLGLKKAEWNFAHTLFEMIQYPVQQQSIMLVDQYVALIEPLVNEDDRSEYFHYDIFTSCCQGQSLELAQHVYTKYKPVTKASRYGISNVIDMFFSEPRTDTNYMNVDIFKWLLTLPGAKSNLNEAMFNAVERGRRDIVDALIEVNANVDIFEADDPQRSHLLFTALKQNDRGIIDLIYNATTTKIDLNERDNNGAVLTLLVISKTGLEWLLDQHHKWEPH